MLINMRFSFIAKSNLMVVFIHPYQEFFHHYNHHVDRYTVGTNRDESVQTNGRLSYKIRLRRKHTTTHGEVSRRLLPELKTVL